MNNRNNQIVAIILSVLAEHTDLSVDELRERCDTDEVALEVDRYIAEHPERLGMNAPSPAVNGSPIPERLSFLIKLGAILPFYDKEIELYFDESDDRLNVSTVLFPEEGFSTERKAAVERFMKDSALSMIVTLEDEGDTLVISTECAIRDPEVLRNILDCWLDILRNDQSFIEAMNDILNM